MRFAQVVAADKVHLLRARALREPAEQSMAPRSTISPLAALVVASVPVRVQPFVCVQHTAFPTPPICYNSIPPKKGRWAENLKPFAQISSQFAVPALGTLRVQRNSAAVECASAPTRPAPDGRGRGFAGAARGRRLPRSVPWPRPSHSDYFARGTLKAPAADRRHSAVGSWSPDLRQVAHQSVIWVLPRPLRSGC